MTMMLGPLFLALVGSVLLLVQHASAQGPAAVACQHDYALCAFANCTIAEDLKTAACYCYHFGQPSHVNMAAVGLIPKPLVKEETLSVCNTSTSCGPSDANTAPICAAIQNKELWPSADFVSTYSPQLQAENGVLFDNTSAAIPTWNCPAAESRLVPVCMLAPCLFSPDDSNKENPYNAGESLATCVCPLVETTVAYPVLGGLQDPCSSDPTKAGDYVTAAGGPLVMALASDPVVLEEKWANVETAFAKLADVDSSGSGGDGGSGNEDPNQSSSSAITSRLWIKVAGAVWGATIMMMNA